MLRPSIALLALTLFPPVQAAESYDNCTGTISSLPATITTQGTWCLKQNLSTGITTGAAITVTTNNVTIDCNDFKVGGLAAGIATDAIGISADNTVNTTIRRCGIRGFLTGISIVGTSAGALVEGNRLDQNTDSAINVAGSGHVVRHNRIVDTGGRPASTQTDGIVSQAEHSVITDNVIVGMTVTADGGDTAGISSFGNACEVARNTILGLLPDDTGESIAIWTDASAGSSIHRNQILSFPPVNGDGIVSGLGNQCSNNNISGYTSGILGCTDGGGNFSN